MLKTWLRVAIVIIVLLVGGIWTLQIVGTESSSAQESGFTQTVSVQQGSLAAAVSVVGELEALQSQDLAFDRLDGTTTLRTLTVLAGTVVAAGDVLATIDPTPYEQTVDRARTDLAEAEAALAELQTPPTTLDLSQADLAVAQAELALRRAEEDLAELSDVDISDLQADVTDAQRRMADAQADLNELEADQAEDTRLSDLHDTESELAAEHARLAGETYSDAYYQDRLRLANNALLAAQDARVTEEIQQQVDLLTAQNNVQQAQRTLTSAQADLAEAQTGVDALELAQARQEIVKAEVDLEAAREARTALDEGPDAVALASAQATVTDAQQAVTEAEEDLAAATLRAPFAGTVLDTYASEGSRITASSLIVALANLDQLQVAASVDETTIRQVANGQSATISFDAFPGQTFSGEVLSVPLQGTLQGDVMVYEVPVSLAGVEELPLRVGMTANVEIQVGSAQNVLLVPSMAVQTLGNQSQVLVPGSEPGGEPVAVRVEVGLSNGIYTEIRSGLNAGDQVLVQLNAGDASNVRFPGGGFPGGGFPGGGFPGGGRP